MAAVQHISSATLSSHPLYATQCADSEDAQHQLYMHAISRVTFLEPCPKKWEVKWIS